ncbi:MAG: ATP-dependent DNA helicase RecG [Gammaproteobacteria bacterium]|nr:ATP-dependent DNA helicase RecG [Gammaproteobacteria bacterium]MCH9743956.1 ATP-dependent DNA helicase RecG [Gammaproteobacteria bacterium]
MSDISLLKGVGPKTRQNLAQLNIHSIEDLLFHLPLRYEDRTRITTMGALQPGDRVLIEGVVTKTTIIGRGRPSLISRIEDDTGFVMLRFFHFNAQQRQRLMTDGLRLRCFGEVRQGRMGGLEMIHPEYRELMYADEIMLSDRLTATYPTTQGLSQPMWRKMMHQALAFLKTDMVLTELLPDALLSQLKLASLKAALIFVHEPPAGIDVKQLMEGVHPAQQRLAFEELLAHHLSLQRLRQKLRRRSAVCIDNPGTLAEQLRQKLPFTLTAAQQRVLQEVDADIRQPYPMMRLLQGDVGSGKTIVSALAILKVVEQGHQAALMAPTELLAEQHFANVSAWFEGLNIKVGFLVSALKKKQHEEVVNQLVRGDIDVMVGTHALFQEAVRFKNLALIVVDEQHRFGVHQRLALKQKAVEAGIHPHQLIMTATPIPRTLAMTAYADLDYSVIDELPPGRQPIQTVLISNDKRMQVLERVRASCQESRQVYWVCTLIDESEALQCQAAEVVSVELKQALAPLTVGLVHGRMKSEDKEAMMQTFKAGDIDVLVATTVIEVGVDVPNASLMVIENAERLGLAQLHQLRGRVGRGSIQSHCVLLYQTPLSSQARQRLKVMRESTDGFYIAEQDLLMRGPGEVLGTQQAGMMRFRVADLNRDQGLLPHIKEAQRYFEQAPEETTSRLIGRWIHHAADYAQV